MTDVPLFDGFEPFDHDDPLAELSPGARMTLRQRGDVRNGRHPLTKGPLHPEASREAEPGPRSAPFTCGSCVHRVASGPHGYPKCAVGPQSRGQGTDVRAWWPACPTYQR